MVWLIKLGCFFCIFLLLPLFGQFFGLFWEYFSASEKNIAEILNELKRPSSEGHS